MTETSSPRPQAFRLDQLDGVDSFWVEPQRDPHEAESRALFGDPLEQATEQVFDENLAPRAGFLSGLRWSRRRSSIWLWSGWMWPAWSWSGLAWSAAGGLVALSFGLWVDQTIEALFARAPALGAVGLSLAALLGLAVIVLIAREIFALLRQQRVARLHRALALAHQIDDAVLARKEIAEIVALYRHRGEFAEGRATIAALDDQIIDGRNLVEIAERALMPGPDARVRREIARAAKRVSLVATLSSHAGLDMIFVAFQALSLIRGIAEIYGGRPGMLGAFKLARAVASHLALTGGMALTDGLAQQILGHGLATKISTRLGEGVVNGALTARIGLSAMALCRPMPFCAIKSPKLGDVAPFLLKDSEAQP